MGLFAIMMMNMNFSVLHSTDCILLLMLMLKALY